MSAPMRSTTFHMSCLSIRHKALPKSLSTPFARAISTSPSSHAAVSATVTTSSPKKSPIVPFHERSVHATVHHFPSFEPIYVKPFPAFHLALPTRHDILHRAIVFEGDNTRRGTASTKWRDEIRGSSRKLRPQKGSGRARLGDKGSPMLKGGGVAFGPKPRDFSTELQRKVYDIAFRTALSYRYKMGQLLIVGNALEIASPSSQLITQILRESPWAPSGKGALFITTEHRPFLATALEQAPRWGLTAKWDEVDVKDLLKGSTIIIEKDALRNILIRHSSDVPPPLKPVQSKHSLPPAELERLLGWTEFQELELARLDEETDPDQLLYLETELYRSLAKKIRTQGAQESQEQADRLWQTALLLEQKSYEAQARLMDNAFHADSREASRLETLAEEAENDADAFADYRREAVLLRAQAEEHRMTEQECLAQVEFTKAELFDFQGAIDQADEARREGEELLEHAEEMGDLLFGILDGEAFEGEGSEEQVTRSKEITARTQARMDAYQKRKEAMAEAEDEVPEVPQQQQQQQQQ